MKNALLINTLTAHSGDWPVRVNGLAVAGAELKQDESTKAFYIALSTDEPAPAADAATATDGSGASDAGNAGAGAGNDGSNDGGDPAPGNDDGGAEAGAGDAT